MSGERDGDRDLEEVARELRARVQELERQLIRRDRGPATIPLQVGSAAAVVDQLAAMLQLEPATIYALDRGGTILDITTTRNKGALLGQSAFDQVHPDSRDLYRHRLDQVLALGQPLELEIKARDDDEEASWYRTRLTPWRVDGVLVGALAVSTPIDDERQARIESKRFRAIMDQANEAIFVVDPRSGRILDVNTTACRLLRYTRGELIERAAQDIEADYPLQTRGQWADYMIEIMAEGTLVREGMFRRKDGTTFPIEATLSIKPFEGDEYLLMVARDVTEARRIKEELRKAEEAIRVSDRLTTVGTLAAGIAHEINNPLAYVMGNIEFAIGQMEEIAPSLPDPIRFEIVESLNEARHGAVRMSRIVRDLRTFSRRDDESSGPVSINEVLDSSINIAMNEIRPRAQLRREYTEDLLVTANEPRLGQVFLNLIINAAQAILPGDSKNQYITVRSKQFGERVAVEVSDTGPGMTPDIASRIFEPFFTTKPIGVGTGLGLSICQNIVDGLGGAIEVYSEVGKGTTFRVILPTATEKVIADSVVKRSTRDGGRSGNILIIDDDHRAAKALRRILYTHQVVIAHEGREGLLRAQEAAFDVIFCDIMMPDFGGIEFYEALCARSPDVARRIIFVTGGTFTQRARAFLEETDNDFISKPYDPAQVRRMVANRVR